MFPEVYKISRITLYKLMPVNYNNYYELYFELIKRGGGVNSMDRSTLGLVLQYNESNLASWSPIEIWPQKQV